MTVAELIRELNLCAPDLMVAVFGDGGEIDTEMRLRFHRFGEHDHGDGGIGKPCVVLNAPPDDLDV